MTNTSQILRDSNAIAVEMPNAELIEISTHVELETVALSWAVRNKQMCFGDPQANGADRGKSKFPFGLPDPTRGATHFHHHNEAPDWAGMLEPVALIGSYLFYDLRDHDIADHK